MGMLPMLTLDWARLGAVRQETTHPRALMGERERLWCGE